MGAAKTTKYTKTLNTSIKSESGKIDAKHRDLIIALSCQTGRMGIMGHQLVRV